MILTSKRLELLDEALCLYTYTKDNDNDLVVIRMSKHLFAELVSWNPFVVFSSIDNSFSNNSYKGHIVELVSNDNYLAVAYFNQDSREIHSIKEIKEE